jgi:hypothetical protein
MTLPSTQLLVYGFGPDADFEGRLGGALERIESGGALRILDALFVASDPDTGELLAIDLKSDSSAGTVVSLLTFRLEPHERRRATERALRPHDTGLPAESLRELGRALPPGESIVALLVEHDWAHALNDAVSRTGGTPLATGFGDATTLAEHAPDLLAAAERHGARGKDQ